ncbi:hypothetical protein FRC12_004129 [Ceratobasidium sp. 428]|nr:hypothetical protein FRC12_004129 [Ceratobasidium sp. 428]
MHFNLQTPISYVRSTNNEKSTLVERRRRPRFSLSLSIDILCPARVIQAQSTDSERSPSFCPSLSPGITPTSSAPFSGPCTPVESSSQDWPRQIAKELIEPSPVFNHVAWSGIGTSRNEFILSPPRSANPSTSLPTKIQDTEPDDPLIHGAHIYPMQSAVPATHDHSPPTRVSDPQAELVGLARDHSVDAELAESGFTPMRAFRRRSGRSHNRDPTISNNPTRGRAARSSGIRSATPSCIVADSYRPLSEKEVKSLKLDEARRHYKCLVDGCERVFGRKSNVENHIRTHLDDKPFVCSLHTCKAAFVRKGDLQRHEQIHRPSRSYMCSWCVARLFLINDIRKAYRDPIPVIYRLAAKRFREMMPL